MCLLKGKTMIRTVLLSTAAMLAALPVIAPVTAHAQETFGGAKGADLSIEAIEPDGGDVTIGRAGEYPADIARYLLASGPGAANLSPDGEWIAFAWDVTGESELWVMPAKGGQPRQVTFKTGVFAPVWTPDGASLFYSADRDGNEQPGYFTVTADGMTESEVLPAQRGDFRIFGDFAQDGSFIYASTARGAGVFDIYRGTLSGDSELLVESELGLAARSISPDGKYALLTEIVGEDADNLYLLRDVLKLSVGEIGNTLTSGAFAVRPNDGVCHDHGRELRDHRAARRQPALCRLEP